jgi:CO/xanthine dehydrogenase Mo-binding subunit
MSLMSEAQDFKYIGQRTVRPDGFDKVTGRANYAADFALPGMIWGRILRSPHAHARIKNIDTTKAEAMPGVLSVATHADFHKSEGRLEAGESTMDVRDLSRNILADDKVFYHGHAVGGVAAKTERVGEVGFASIEIYLEVLAVKKQDLE